MKNNLYTIPAHLPFADTLAEWVLGVYGAEPHKLPRILMLLPSRRACLSLRESFLRVSKGKPLLLPRMQPLGDIPEELLLAAPLAQMPADLTAPSPAFEYKRLFTLARLISRQREQVLGHKESMDYALRLAMELAQLLDEVEREQVSLSDLASLVPDTFAAHWQITVDFLKILSEHWPQITAQQGIVTPESYRTAMLGAVGRHWQASPPAYPVIAAGTTGSIPATAELLKTIRGLAHGSIVLPGLDTHASDEYFSHINESHPQWGMRQLLTRLQCERQDVQVIGKDAGNARAGLLGEVMRPPETSGAWQNITLHGNALSELKRFVCANVQEEASVIALMLREVLETPAKTAALVTHDRPLARRVAAIMQRYGVTVDDSAGVPLGETPIAGFLRLILEVVANGFAPVPLLALLKHPLTHAGMERIECLEAARALEALCLRGIRAGEGIAGLKESLKRHLAIPSGVHTLVNNFERSMAPLMVLLSSEPKEISLGRLIEAHLQCAEALAGETLWQGPEAGDLTAFISALRKAAESGEPIQIEPDNYPALFETLLAGKVFRPEYGAHPRLKILSPIEARMQSFDRIIIGGLNEGSWPPAVTSDPWFNRPMRTAIGLPAEERRIGLAAHDFFMLASQPEVYLTRAEKTDGVPTTPARWLVKLDALLTKFSLLRELEAPVWIKLAQMLDAPAQVTACKPPAPCPPSAARPRKLSVTQIETWLRDPYSLYAMKVLRLKKLDPLGQEPSGADFGKAVHKALENFVKAFPSTLPADAYEQLLHYGRDALQPLFFNAVVEALWWPRFMRIAAFIISEERLRRPGLKSVFTEVDGVYRLKDFVLTGRADRIEDAKDGSLTIVDYKTGTLPTLKEIDDGISSQLVLLALIAADGDMPVRGPAGALEYWRLHGGGDVATIRPVDEAKIDGLIEEAKRGLEALIAKYDDPAFPYLSTPIPSRARHYNDYNHLARVKEWS